jgi:hypothetical protein
MKRYKTGNLKLRNYVAAAAALLLAAVGSPRRKACIAPNFKKESVAEKSQLICH